MENKRKNNELENMILKKIEYMETEGYQEVPKLKKADYIATAVIVFISLTIFYVTYLTL